MTEKEKFDLVKMFTDKLIEQRKTGTLRFKDGDEKVLLKTVYQSIYGMVQVELACSNCVHHYLCMMEAWYEREYPKYLKTLPVEIPAVEIKVVSKPKRNKKGITQ